MELSDSELVATGAVGFVALLSLILAIVSLIKLRRLRRGQKLVLGESGKADLVAHAAALQREFGELHRYVEEISQATEVRTEVIEGRLDHALTRCALVRYDAYGEQSGHQSTSIALLDSRSSGVLLSSIVHRDHARLYSKLIVEGKAERELSPEEDEALHAAISGKSLVTELS